MLQINFNVIMVGKIIFIFVLLAERDMYKVSLLLKHINLNKTYSNIMNVTSGGVYTPQKYVYNTILNRI
jgi:hypothetical protein